MVSESNSRNGTELVLFSWVVQVHVAVLDALREYFEYQLQKKAGQHVITYRMRVGTAHEHIRQNMNNGKRKEISTAKSQNNF